MNIRRRRPDCKIVRIKRKANGVRKGRREVIDEEVEEDWAKDGSLRDAAPKSKRVRRDALEGYMRSTVREERLCPANKAGRQARGQKLVIESWMPDRVEGARKIYCGKHRSGTGPRAMKAIRDRLCEINYLVSGRSAWAKTGLKRCQKIPGLEEIS